MAEPHTLEYLYFHKSHTARREYSAMSIYLDGPRLLLASWLMICI